MENIARYFSYPEDNLLIYGAYEPWLVLLSVLVAMTVSSIAFQVAGQARKTDAPGRRRMTILTGSIALGGAVWSMHFIGMLAFDLCTPVRYAPLLTALSMLPSIAASMVALEFISRPSIRFTQLVVGGVLVGAGIGTMHYAGMAAMVMAPLLRYDPLTFLLSIVVAVVLAMLALWIRFGIDRVRWRIPMDENLLNLLSGMVMGLAISGMHYTGMAAARFVRPDDPGFTLQTQETSMVLALAVALATIIITGLVLAVNLTFRYRDASRLALAGEARLQTIMETAVDGIISFDRKGRILSANPAVSALLGWPREELLGRDVKEILPDPYRNAYDSFISRYLDIGENQIIGNARDMEALHRSGQQIPIRLAIGHAQFAGEHLFVAYLSDIRQRIEHETALNDANARLTREVSEHAQANVALEKAMQELRATQEHIVQAEKMASLGSMVAGVAHEINTPLGVSMTALSILEAHTKKLVRAAEQGQVTMTDSLQYASIAGESVSMIGTNLRRAAELVASFKQLAVDQTSGLARNFNLKEIIDEAILSLKSKLRQTRIQVEVDCPDDIEMYGHPGSIVQILTNFIMNSLIHGFEPDDEGSIRIHARREQDTIRLLYTDNGKGMNEEQRTKIFEPFYTTRRDQGGTGLGMHIVYNLVCREEGGAISLDSAPGEGVAFSLTIPAGKLSDGSGNDAV